jgi:hypothetical protein
MAAVKTTPLQIALQVGTGLTIAGIIYYSLVRPKQDSHISEAQPVQPAAVPVQDLEAALNREAQNTTAKYWGRKD